MTIELCQAACSGNGYHLAGLEFAGECWCGQSISSNPAPESECSMQCTG